MGRTPCHTLMTVSSLRNFEIDVEAEQQIAQLLINAEADPLIKDSRGKTALNFAALRHGSMQIFPGYQEEQKLAHAAREPWIYNNSKEVTIQRKHQQCPNGNVVSWREVLPIQRDPKE